MSPHVRQTRISLQGEQPSSAVSYGGIEAGGTKWLCGLASDDGTIIATAEYPTGPPASTVACATAFFQTHGPLRAIGVGCFGPLDMRRSSPTYGWITATPKAGWSNTDILGPLQASLRVPTLIDTDVNAAALGEARYGHGRGLATFAYVTVGTGIGVGVVANGEILRGLSHPEAGHIRIPHDWERDPFPGSCPFHGDCLEGLASGDALRKRYGCSPEALTDERVWELEAEYLALGLLSVIHILAPQRLIVGGGVMRRPALLARVRDRIVYLMSGYPDVAEFTDPRMIDNFIVRPALGGHSGLVGAIELARAARDPSET